MWKMKVKARIRGGNLLGKNVNIEPEASTYKRKVEHLNEEENQSQVDGMPKRNKILQSVTREDSPELEYKENFDVTGTLAIQNNNMNRSTASHDIVVLNTDAATDNGKEKAGLGIVPRNVRGNMLATWAVNCHVCDDVVELEGLTIRLATQKAIEEEWRNVLILSDSKKIVATINSNTKIFCLLGVILDDIQTLQTSLDDYNFAFVRREKNKISYVLAKFTINLCYSVIWKFSFPVWLERLAQEF
ncbi:hypothetical protein ACH5RR_001838 [Cinchona calisaya]|uniref:RNase H type-1 domain-containing protein n=1 Tax=Cinchona calisaya TaxID=153742 RepID=A0ABD3B4J5_9GENT